MRRPTLDEALDAAIQEMRAVSAHLLPNDDCDERVEAFYQHNPRYLWRVIPGE